MQILDGRTMNQARIFDLFLGWADLHCGVEMYSKLCQIVMDLSHLPYRTHRKVNGGGVYYEIQYDYILFYHGVELKAQMSWRENVCIRFTFTEGTGTDW